MKLSSFTAYVKQLWKNKPDTSTPLSAERLTHMEEGIKGNSDQACTFYLKRKYCTVEDRDNLEYMFRPYKALGGNGTGEELYNRCLALPYESAEQEV